MPTDELRQAETKRYASYALAAMTTALFLVFLYLFNFTSFFRLAVPL